MVNTLAWLNPEIAIIAFVGLLVLVGGKKIPELMRGIGQGVGELKKGMDEGKQQLMAAARPDETPVPVATQIAAPTPVTGATPTSTPQ